MKYINTFKNHASYEEKLNGGGVDISLPNVSYCEDVKDVHYTPYNLVRFYVGEITEPQTVKIYTYSSTYVDVQVSEVNKWYTYALPKDKGLYKIKGDSVKKVVVKADIKDGIDIIPISTIEVSFKGSDTSHVTDMRSMFSGCSGLTSLDLSSFDTSNVTNMDSMFNRCRSLNSLDLSSFNTSKVTNMESMFSSCSKLISLDLRNFNTSKVTNTGGMFSNCSSLTSLYLSGWDTSNVTNMPGMFSNCSSLASLDLSGWDTSNVTNTGGMFNGCSSLTSLDLSGWNISNETIMGGMFGNCTSLTSIRMVGCSTEAINAISGVKPSSAEIVIK